MSLAADFLAQNTRAAADLTVEQVEPYAAHHCGGLIVLEGTAPDGRYVKMHDSWKDGESVIVHVYNPDGLGGDPQTVDEHARGDIALERFLHLIRQGVTT